MAVGLLSATALAVPHHAVAAPQTSAHGDTDAQRRDRLNARLSDMLRSGEGARLTQPEPPRRRATPNRRAARPSAVTAAAAAATPATVAAPPPAAPVVGAMTTPPAYSIQPPAFVGGAQPRSSGAYYTPPRLDLTTAPRIPDNDVECLTQAIYYEARNESEEGQAAVAEVVMNRSRSGAYPRSVCAVVYQRNSRTCQFTFTCDGAIGRSPVDLTKWARAEMIAREVHENRRTAALPPNSLNYHASYVSPSWGRRLERVRQIGTHIFYGAPLNGGVTPGAEFAPVPTTPASTGLVFVRNEALDRAYEAAIAATTPTASSGQP